MKQEIIQKIKNITSQQILSFTKNTVTLKCDCGTPYTKNINDLLFYKKARCKSCGIKSSANTRRQSIEKVKAFIEQNNCLLLTTQYKNPHEKLKIQCRCGNIFSQSYSDFRSINRRTGYNCCPECSKQRRVKNQTFTFEEVKSFISSTGCTLISTEYETQNTPLTIKCRICGTEFVNTLKDFKNNGTYACSACTSTNISQKEKQLVDFLNNYCSIEQNNRTILNGKEIDIFIPEYNISIEYNNVYFHSKKFGKDKNYHLQKTEICESKNIKLFHIWENEWNHSKKQQIWKSIILNKIRKTQHTIFARKCIVKPIDVKTKNRFLNDNHLQGEDKSTIKYGLFFKDKLVMVMTFGKPRFNKKYQYELIRLSSLLNTNVIGGASKLFSHFLKNHPDAKTIITYADRRFSSKTNNVFEQLGFRFERYTQPNYYYTKQNRVYNRLSFQKHKLSKKVKIFDPQKSEVENMMNNGYYRIWDCGHLVFTFKR